jgi:hypothetical protein
VAEWRPGGTRRVARVSRCGAGVHGTHETHSGEVLQRTRFGNRRFLPPTVSRSILELDAKSRCYRGESSGAR